MIESFTNFIFKLFEDFSLKKLLTTVIALLVLAAGVLIYEIYTSNFELSRIEKSAEILTVLNKIASRPIRANDEVQAIKSQLLHDLRKLVEQKPPTAGISELLRDGITSDKFIIFLSGAAPWLFLLLLSLPSFKKSGSNAGLIVFGLFSLVSGWLATILNLNLSVIATSILFFLVPLVILGMLGVATAIAIPQFAAYRIRGYNASAISTLRNSRTLLESYFADHGVYPHALDQADIHPIQHINLEFKLINQDKYFLSATHDQGNKVYFVSSETNEILSKDKQTNQAATEKSPPDVTLVS